MADRLFRVLASIVEARANCAKSGNAEWLSRHTGRLETLVKRHLPSGAGFDNGTRLDLDRSDPSKGPDRLVFDTSFHHMDEHGSYDGWTDHTVTIRPSLAHGYRMTISGPDRRGIKELIGQAFAEALDTEIVEGPDAR